MIGVEGADQGEEEPSHHHVATGMSLPHEPSHVLLRTAGAVGLQIAAVGLQVAAVFNFKLSESCKDLCLFLLFGSGRPWVDTLFGFSEHVGQTDEHGGEPLVVDIRLEILIIAVRLLHLSSCLSCLGLCNFSDLSDKRWKF
jgi:hypothetical protein